MDASTASCACGPTCGRHAAPKCPSSVSQQDSHQRCDIHAQTATLQAASQMRGTRTRGATFTRRQPPFKPPRRCAGLTPEVRHSRVTHYAELAERDGIIAATSICVPEARHSRDDNIPRFALSFNKIGGISAKKIKQAYFFALDLHYLCPRNQKYMAYEKIYNFVSVARFDGRICEG